MKVMFHIEHQMEKMKMELAEKKATDLREIITYTQRLMDIVSEYEDSRPSAMSFIKLEEALMWMQVMNGTTNYRGPGFVVKKDEENKVA